MIVLKRILAVIVIVFATVAFLANAVGLVGVCLVRRPARDAVRTLSTSVSEKLGKIDGALTRVTARADEGRKVLEQINDLASKLGDRLEENSPLLNTLTVAARDDLAPKITELRTQAAALHDAAVSVNAVLETLRNFGLKVPTFTDELNAISERLDAAQPDIEELRATIDEAKTATVAQLVSAVTVRTTKIDSVIAQIKSTAAKQQAMVAPKQQQITDLSRKVVRVINITTLVLGLLFLTVAAGQALLIHVCWQYVHRGRFGEAAVHA